MTDTNKDKDIIWESQFEKEYMMKPIRIDDDMVEVSNRPGVDNVRNFYLTKEQREHLRKYGSVVVKAKQHKSWRPSA